MHTEIQLEFEGTTALLKLVPPPGKPPTLDYATLARLDAALDTIAKDPPRCVVVRSAEPKYFCVGANINVLKETNSETIVPWCMEGHRIFNRLESLPCPVLAEIHGYAFGGGLELAMACDVIYAATEARLAQSEAALGFIPGWGGTGRLVRRLGLSKAKQLFFTGTAVGGDEAREIGLVDLAVPAADLAAAVEEFTTAVAHNDASALSTFKQLVHEPELLDRDRCAAAEAQASRGCLENTETIERLTQFLNKRK
ncbi:MAG: enoyl-CoA hydratase/isomerase family protein [Opitutae bacterium]|nr:enoyl-CoA hydratase/isomerase family protein [Opitutae bacterium]